MSNRELSLEASLHYKALLRIPNHGIHRFHLTLQAPNSCHSHGRYRASEILIIIPTNLSPTSNLLRLLPSHTAPPLSPPPHHAPVDPISFSTSASAFSLAFTRPPDTPRPAAESTAGLDLRARSAGYARVARVARRGRSAGPRGRTAARSDSCSCLVACWRGVVSTRSGSARTVHADGTSNSGVEEGDGK